MFEWNDPLFPSDSYKKARLVEVAYTAHSPDFARSLQDFLFHFFKGNSTLFLKLGVFSKVPKKTTS